MILLVHSVFGAGIGWEVYRLTGNISLALLFALLSHYFLDFFPHIEYLVSVDASMERKSVRDIATVAVDFIIGFFLIFIFSNNIAFAGMFGVVALIPDGLTVLYKITQVSFLAAHQDWHERIQYLTKYRKFSKVVRITTQATALVIGIVLLAAR